jgi:hypothetical protein
MRKQSKTKVKGKAGRGGREEEAELDIRRGVEESWIYSS